MTAILIAIAGMIAAEPASFQRHDIDSYAGGYQVAVADISGDGRPDVIALSTAADCVDWFENPTWKKRPVARTAKNIDLACSDIDGDGQLEIALATGFYFNESRRGGEIFWLKRTANLDESWQAHPIATDPVVHRLRWGDVDGDGRMELVHASIFGPGSDNVKRPQPAHLWAFRVPDRPERQPWQKWTINETLPVLHGIEIVDFDGDGRNEILTASFDGIHRLDFPRDGEPGTVWRKTPLAAGAPPRSNEPGAPRGSSEVAAGRAPRLLAAIEPWHGNEVVVYRPNPAGDSWRRQVLDDKLVEGHALVVADFDGDGLEEIVAGWRGGEPGLALYDPADAEGTSYRKVVLDRGIAVEGIAIADLNQDGRLDLAVIAGRTNNLAWYENVSR